MKFKQLSALTMFALLAFIALFHGLALAVVLGFVCLATLAGTGAIRRGQLGAAPDTNDVISDLNLNEILDSAIKAFARTILPLRLFATVWRNVQLQGTDIVEVPYYPLQGITSKDFSGTYDFGTGAGSKTEVRKVTVNKRKYQTLQLSGRDLARLPMLNAQTVGELKGQKLAYDVIRDILSVVTAANYPGIAFTGLAGSFDSDGVIDIRTACDKNAQGPLSVTDGVTSTDTSLVSATANFGSNDIGIGVTGSGIPANTKIASVTNATTVVLSAATTGTATGVTVTIDRPITPWPDTMRGLLLTPDYDGALLKDSNFRRDLTVAQSDVVNTGRLPNVYGFDYGRTAAIPTNGENLVGMATYMSAILAAFSPIEPPEAVRKVMTQYEVLTDAESEIAMEYRVWGDPNSDKENRVFECNYGYNVGESQAIKRIKSA
jgi:hypothetical protein